jgi:hypothetical protein
VLELSDTNPSKVQGVLSSLVDALLSATKPQPDTTARLERLLKATQTQTSDLSTLLKELLLHPEQIVPKAGYFPPNVADIIRLRSESINRAEYLKSRLEGMGRDVILSKPAEPSMKSGRSDRIKVVVEAMGITFVFLAAIIVLRHILMLSARSPFYEARMRRIREALPWQRAPKDAP